MYKEILDKYGEEYILRQLAEECNELAQAALKYIRAKRGETPVDAVTAKILLIEEMADVEVAMEAMRSTGMTLDDCFRISQMCHIKAQRWAERMLDGKTEGDDSCEDT